jgi:MFS transporter, FHS family, L-fucose permease
LVIAGIFLAVATLIYFADLPEVHEQAAPREADATASWRGALSHAHLVKGVIAQFLYVGAQVGVGSFVIRFVQHVEPGLGPRQAARYLQLHLIGFMIGRFAGSALMKSIRASRLLAIFAFGALVCVGIGIVTTGALPVYAIVLIGFFHSIMFPTIFALSIKNLGPFTKRGSSLLVMSIIGGAIIPAVMGRISDLSNIQRAFLVPLLCYAYVLYFGVSGYKPSAAISVAREPAAEGVPQ